MQARAVDYDGTGRSFFLVGALIIAAVVFYGFSFTVGDNLFHPPYPRPAILYVHALVAATWVPLLIVQASLVRLRRVDLHRVLGRWGVVHGTLLPVLAMAAAIAMAKVRLAHNDTDAAVSFPIPVNDALGFSIAFALAIRWRRRPDYHRRLVYIASCILTGAAFGRIPPLDNMAEWFYSGVDVLILIGALRDLIASGRIHPVYRYGLPAVIAGQLLTACVRWSPQWLAMAVPLFQ